jgi:hypothetical protein
MTAEELDLEIDFEFKADFGTTAKFTADSFRTIDLSSPGAKRAEVDTESYSSNVYWQIAVDTEDLKDLD